MTKYTQVNIYSKEYFFLFTVCMYIFEVYFIGVRDYSSLETK